MVSIADIRRSSALISRCRCSQPDTHAAVSFFRRCVIGCDGGNRTRIALPGSLLRFADLAVASPHTKTISRLAKPSMNEVHPWFRTDGLMQCASYADLDVIEEFHANPSKRVRVN